MNRIAKWLYGVYALALAGLAFGQPGSVNIAKPPVLSSSPWVAVAAAPPGTNNTVLTITTPNLLPTGTVGVAYSLSFAAAGGVTPYTWSVASGVVPAGLTLGSGGLLSGTPTGAGLYAFSILVADSAQAPSAQTASMTFTLRISAALSITTTSPINATAGSSLTVVLSATGGTPLYLWFVAAGSQLPPGFTLDTSSGSSAGLPPPAGHTTSP
jgi:hypothetical protein